MSLFNQKHEEKISVVGRKTELIHDITSCQYGAVIIDDIRYSVKVTDGAELLKGTVVEVIEESNPYGTTILTVKKI